MVNGSTRYQLIKCIVCGFEKWFRIRKDEPDFDGSECEHIKETGDHEILDEEYRCL